MELPINHIFKIPSASDFLTTHIPYLQRIMVDSRGSLDEFCKNKKLRVNENPSIHSYLEKSEHWRNKIQIDKCEIEEPRHEETS